jgi:hypothetical protein
MKSQWQVTTSNPFLGLVFYFSRNLFVLSSFAYMSVSTWL